MAAAASEVRASAGFAGTKEEIRNARINQIELAKRIYDYSPDKLFIADLNTFFVNPDHNAACYQGRVITAALQPSKYVEPFKKAADLDEWIMTSKLLSDIGKEFQRRMLDNLIARSFLALELAALMEPEKFFENLDEAWITLEKFHVIMQKTEWMHILTKDELTNLYHLVLHNKGRNLTTKEFVFTMIWLGLSEATPDLATPAPMAIQYYTYCIRYNKEFGELFKGFVPKAELRIEGVEKRNILALSFGRISGKGVFDCRNVAAFLISNSDPSCYGRLKDFDARTGVLKDNSKGTRYTRTVAHRRGRQESPFEEVTQEFNRGNKDLWKRCRFFRFVTFVIYPTHTINIPRDLDAYKFDLIDRVS